MAANNAVVGILRAMLTADTAQFDTGMRKAGDTLKGVGDKTKKVGEEVAKIAPQAERMVKSFQGDKLLYTANNLVTAIAKVGGATKLTEAEQARANRTLSDAIAKYALLGQKAPQAMVDLEQATRKAEQATKSLGQGANAVFQDISRLTKSFQGREAIGEASRLVAAITKVGGATKLTEAEQARANRTLTEAIAKYAALGKKAPAEMLALQRATAGATAQTTRFGLSIDQVRGVLGAFGITLGVGAVVAFSRALLDTADQLVRVADRTGLTTTEVQKLQFIAKQSGNSLDELTGAVSRLQNNLVTGDKGAIAAVKALGINLAQLRAATPFDQMEQIATAIAKIPDPATRAAIAMDLFGRTGAAILPTLIADFQRLGNEAPIMSDKTVRALDDAGDALNKFQMQLKVWAAESFNFAGRLYDMYIGAVRRGTAAGLDAVATLLEMTAKLPGMGALFDRLGISISGLRSQAQWFRDAADATTSALNRVEPEVRKNTGAMIDYEGAVTKGTKATKAFADEYGKLNREMANLQGMAFFNYDVELMRMNDLSAGLEGLLGTLSKINEAMILPSGRVPGAMGAPAPTLGARRVQEQKDVWNALTEGATRSLQLMDTAIAGSFAQMAMGAKGFKDGFIDIWESIKHSIINILADVLSYFTKQFIGGLIKGLTGARLGQALGTAISGGVTSAALGAGVSAAGLGGTAAAAGSVGTGGAVAGAGAGLGLGATVAITGGAAAGAILAWAVIKKGLFRGGEERLVNPRRDQFTAQFGGGHNLAARLTGLSGEHGGGHLFSALQRADSQKEFEAAQSAIAGFLGKHGQRNVKLFNFGGFVPPGVTQPAILHGGRFGEDVMPRTSSQASAGPSLSIHNTFNISSIDARGVREFVESRDFLDSVSRAFTLNKGFIATRVRPTLVT